MNEAYSSIGLTGKAKGVKGLLKARIEDAFAEHISALKVIFLKVDGQLLPFFVEEVIEGPDFLIKLEAVDAKEDAQKLSGKEILARKNDLPDVPDQTGMLTDNTYNLLEGFCLIDEVAGEVGAIEEIVELPQQMMALVQYQGKELLIPLNESLIKELDPAQKKLYMVLPEGLLEL